MRVYRVITLLALFALILASCGGGGNESAGETPTVPDIPELNLPERLAEQLKSNPKISTAVQKILIAYQEGGRDAAVAQARKAGLIDKQNNLLLQIVLDTDDEQVVQQTIELLESEGVVVLGTIGPKIDISIPPAVLEKAKDPQQRPLLIDKLSQLDHVKYIDAQRNISPMGAPARMEGADVIQAQTWHERGVTGEGVKIGIIDYGFDNYKGELGKTLPPEDKVIVRSFVRGADVDEADETHGTMVANVIHAIAPDATLYFAYVWSTSSIFDAAGWLQSQGVQIINHSGGGPMGPFNGDHELDQLVDQVSADGILWINAAGNDGSAHWRGEFKDDGEGWHVFADGRKTICIRDFYRGISLHWWENPESDFDLYLYEKVGSKLQQIDYSLNSQPATPPSEWIAPFDFRSGECYYAAIKRTSGDDPVTLDIFASNSIDAIDQELAVREHSVTNPGTSKRALTVGAVLWDSDRQAHYSSEGPTEDNRLKPEISAPTEVSTSQGNFGGTSAATPHVAGAAALLLSANPELRAEQLSQLLRDASKDLGADGPDPVFGSGRLLLPSVDSLLKDKPEIVPTPEPEVRDIKVFEDTYDDPTTGLVPEGSGDGWSSGYVDGHYLLTARFAQASFYNIEYYEGIDVEDLYLAIDMEERPSTGKSAAYGVHFRAELGPPGPDGGLNVLSHYSVERLGNTISLFRIEGDQTTKLAEGEIPRRRFKFLRQRQLHIELQAQGPQIDVAVNGDVVISVEDPSPLGSGQIGLWVSNRAENKTAEVWFDNLFVETSS